MKFFFDFVRLILKNKRVYEYVGSIASNLTNIYSNMCTYQLFMSGADD